MKTQELSFDEWFGIALAFYRTKFKHLPLDRDAALDGYNEALSPEEYIKNMVDSWDSNDE